MRQASTIVAVATLATLTACGGDTNCPAKPTTVGMSARIDGVAWNAVSVATDSAPPSLLILSGTNATATLTLIIPINQGLGKQTVGSITPIAAGLVIGSKSWLASRTQGGAGSVTLTTVAPGHVAGSFEFALAAHDGASPATQPVTSGTFDGRY